MKLAVFICLLVPLQVVAGSCINKTVEVLVATGNGLSGDLFGEPDPYIVIQIGNETQQSSVIYSTSNPSWWETFQFNSTSSDDMKIEVWERDGMLFGGDDLLGTCTEKLTQASNATMVHCTMKNSGVVNLYYECSEM